MINPHTDTRAIVCPHVNNFTPAAVKTVLSLRNSRLLKVLYDQWAPDQNRQVVTQYLDNNPSADLMFRPYFDDEGSDHDLNDPVGRARAVVDQVNPILDKVTIIEAGWNEVHQWTSDGIAAYAKAVVEHVKTLRALTFHPKIFVGGFGVMNPRTLQDWDQFRPALEVADGLHLHEYDSPNIWLDPNQPHPGRGNIYLQGGQLYGDRLFRYREAYDHFLVNDFPVLPLIISEFGRDHGLTQTPHKGWRYGALNTRGNDAEVYAGEVERYAAHASQDSFVHAICVFACGTKDWPSYDTATVPAFRRLFDTYVKPIELDMRNMTTRREPVSIPTYYEQWINTPNNEWAALHDADDHKLKAFIETCQAVGKPVQNRADAEREGYPPVKGGLPKDGYQAPIGKQQVAIQVDPPAHFEIPKSLTDGTHALTQYLVVAHLLGCDPVDLQTVFNVESSGQPFGPDGKPTIRFELHQFDQRLTDEQRANCDMLIRFRDGKRTWVGNQHQICDRGVWRCYHDGTQASEYEALALAAAINRPAAFEATSMGLGQIMGFNHERLFYDSAQEMLENFDSVVAQTWAFAGFVVTSETLLTSLRNGDFATFAREYNGERQVNHYVDRMHEEKTRILAAVANREKDLPSQFHGGLRLA